jgi:excisionase family DNA binding protein
MGTMATRSFYTVTEAAEALEVSQRRLLEMLEAGELEGERDSQSSRWKISKRAVHELVPETVRTGPLSEDTAEQSSSPPAETVGELIGELGNLQKELGRLRNRLELARQAADTAWQEERELLIIALEQEREQAQDALRAERERLLEDQRRERERADELQKEKDTLTEELKAERNKVSWRRLLGG